MVVKVNETMGNRFYEALDRWVRQGLPPGNFLQAVLRNDLLEAVNRADDEALLELRAIVRHLYNCCPGGCWGSPDNVKAWTAHQGIQGLDNWSGQYDYRNDHCCHARAEG